MAVKLKERDDSNLLEVQVSGTLTHADYQQFVPKFEQMAQRYGKIRVLFEMSDFHGWNAAALWDDVKFDLRHFSDIERLAIVGDKAWEKGMSVFCRPFTTAEIRYFDRSVMDDARQWIEAP